MNKLFTKIFRILTIVAFSQQVAFSQTCPDINAQVGTGASTTICLGQCASLTASIVPVKATTTYSVGSITYAAFPFSGGVTLPSVDDVWSDSLNIGFNFCYFGTTYNKLVVGSNGEINFNKMLANGFNNYNVSTTLPNTIDLPGNSICGIFKDIDLSAGGIARTYTTGIAPCRKFVAYWENVPLYQGPGDNCGTILNTFQIVLHEGSNSIDINVESTAPCGIGGNTDRGIIGIQNASGTIAFAPPGRNVLTSWSATNESWRFDPNGAPTYTVSWSGPSGFTAAGLTATPCPTATSNYTATMNVSNCDGSITPYTSVVQVSVNVTPTVAPVATPTSICRGSSTTITATGATSYSWNPGSLTTSSIVVSPTVTTTYTLTRSNGSCATTNTISIIVYSLPTITAVSNPTVICPGSTSATLTSTGASTYTWNPGGLVGNTVVVSPASSTQYTVTATNGAGCQRVRTLNVNVNPSPTIAANTLSATVCAGSTTTLTGSGASSYTWTPGSATGATVVVTPTANTIYTVTGRSTGGCIDTETVSISVTPGITVSVTATPTILCSGQSATLTSSGATTYTWNPGAITGNSISVTPTVTSTYSVTGTASGCTNTKTVSIVVNTPNIIITKNPATLCEGSTATLSATGASTYTWNPGGSNGTSVVITPSATTVYSVAGTNTMGCQGTKTISVVVNPTPTVTIGATSSSICTGGSATLTAGGGTSYTWSPGSSTLTAIVVSPTTTTTYSLTGRNASGCRATTTISIFVSPVVTVTSSASPTLICNGSSSTLTATGATNYTWMPGTLTGSNVVVSPSVTTTYSVTGENSFGCANSATVNLVVSTINLTATSNPSVLCSANSATLTGTGASSYTWNPGALTGSTIVVTPLATTVYTVVGINALGCTDTKTLNLSVGVTPTITASTSSTLVCSDNTLTLSSSGASTYTWMPGSLTGSVVIASPSTNTTYTVTGENAAGCTTTNTVDVSVNPSPVIVVNSNPTVLCPGFSATLTATGAPTYTWNPGAIANGTIVVSPAATTIYSVVGTSSLGCTGSATVNLKVNPSPTVTASSSSGTICSGSTATLTGGGANSYTWNPGAITGTNVAVSPTVNTTYTVTGDNGLGCISTETITIDVLPTLTVTASSSPTIICAGNSATLSASGGTSYTWTPGSIVGSSVTVNPISTTIYTVTGENSFGCTNTETVTLTVSTITVTATSNPTILCSGGGATLTAMGATNYTWSPGALTGATVSVNPAATTVYTVVGTTSLGCTATETLNLTVNAIPTITATSSPAVICAGSSATLTASGATSYTWNPGIITGSVAVVSPATSTIYTVTGANGACINTATVSLTVNALPTLTTTSNPTVICAGASATLTGAGATSYTWNPGAITGSVAIVNPTTTTVYTVTGANGSCTSTSTISLSVNTLPTLTATANPAAICAGATATLSGSGASTYTWNPGTITGSTVTVTPATTTVYTLTGISATGCANTTTVSLTVNSVPTLTAAASAGTICAGSTATLGVIGAISYTWNPGALTGFTTTVSPTLTTTYTVTGVNASGCVGTTTVLVNVAPNVTVTAVSNPTIICAGSSATLTGNGATSYTWNPGALTGTATVVSPTVTTIYTVTGSNGACTNTSTVSLTVNPAPIVNASSNPTVICIASTATLTGTGASTYTWNPGALTGASITVTPTITTTYTLDGTDAIGCTGSQTLNVTVSNPTVSATASSNTICAGNTATLTGAGSSTYTWNPGNLTGTTAVVNPTITTIYTVTATNASGCIATNSIQITVITNPTITANASPTAVCAGNTATLTANGSVSYTWSPGALTGTMVTVNPTVTTTYTVMSDNGIGCTNSETVTITVNTNPTLTLSASPNAICLGNSSTLTATGATSYTWNPGALTGTSTVVSPTSTTTYTVDGDNGFGCIGSTTLTINVNTPPTLTVSASSATLCAGSVTLTASGGTTYTWSPVTGTTASIVDSPTITTTYTVMSDNGTGCIGTQTVTVNVIAIPTLTLSASANTICLGSSATLNATGATFYTWNPGALTGSTTVVSPTVATTYTVTGDNGGGCINTETITIFVGPAISVTATASSNTICAGSSATLTGSGATSYTWNPGNSTGTTTIVSPSVTTTYTMDADNGTGCVANSTVTVNVNAIPTISISATSTILCSSATVTMTASGANTYTWMPIAAVTPSVTDSPTVTTIYTVTGADAIGCSNTETISITVSATPTITASSTATTICAGTSATLTGSGATSYTWNPGAITGTTTVVTPSITTTYTVDGDNGAGCIASNTITINVNSAPSISVAATSTVLCSTGSITLTASGGTTYTWSPISASTASVVDSPTITTTYTVTGDNGAGCIGTQTITVNVGTSPTMTITSSPTGTICVGTTATLTANGAVSYTWNPTGAITNTITDAPSVTTTYTITGDNGFGCIGTNTFVLDVAPGTAITAVANPTAVCANSTVSLSASGAITYTWMPMGISGATVTATPSVGTTYTVLGDNGTCVATSTVFVDITPGPLNVTSMVSGDITCNTPSVNLFGNTTSSPVTYMWTGPGSFTTAVQNPTGIATGGTYTLDVLDGITGCSTTSTVAVITNTTIPGLTALASGNLGCVTTVTLTAASTTTNALTYTWSGPSSFTSTVQSPTTSIAGDYTVAATDALTGCSATATVTVLTSTTSLSFTASVSGSLTCIGDVTLTATSSSTNALTYLWSGPSSFTSTVQNPTTTVAGDYTISVTETASGCSSISTIAVTSNTVGPNLTAITSGSLGCATSVTLNATTTSTNSLTYTWSGPSSFTAAIQSPTATVAGDYTVNATDALTGCSSTSTVTVGTSTTIPVVGIAVPGPVLGCNTTVTLSVITIPTPPYSFNWSGPASFTSTAQTPTTSVAGDYTVTVTDTTNGCSNIVSINVTTNTLVPAFTATAVPATCTGTVTNNDGTIIIAGYNGSTDTYDLSQAATYTGTATYLSGNAIPFGGILTNTLVNPAAALPYTIRVFSNNGCYKDTTVMLIPTNCSVTSGGNVLGMTKAVSTPTFVNNNAYNVTYTIVATNASTVNLTGFSVVDDLNITFPLPTTYSVISMPVITSLNSSLTVNTAYNGSTQNDMLIPLTSTLTAGRKDTIVFTVQINPNGFFGPFSNSAIGFGFDGALTISDISNTGFAWDPDNDGDPTNNDTATVVTLTPNTQLGVAKSGMVSEILADKTLDVTYTISVKNLGNDTIQLVQVMDTLNFASPAQYTIKSSPSASGSLVANSNYNGNSDIALLNAGLSKLAPGQTETITFILNITPNDVKSITNIAIGSGVGANGGIVKDSSNTGTESDPNGNGIATEAGENIPTVLELPDVNLFIPEVFTPDGDGKNDFFVIKGISGRTVKLTVFNRWGSKVYANDAYDNTWNGTPNVGGLTIGNGTMPQGTYYYIVEFEDGNDDAINGYVVLQY